MKKKLFGECKDYKNFEDAWKFKLDKWEGMLELSQNTLVYAIDKNIEIVKAKASQITPKKTKMSGMC